MASNIGFEHVPVARPPKPIASPPICSPEFNMQLNVTPEKKGVVWKSCRPNRKKEATGNCGLSNGLSKPQINSTALVAQKLKELSQSTFDANAVVQQEFEKSEKCRLEIAEKASEALNYNLRETKYTDLVSLDVSVSNLGVQQRKVFKDKKGQKQQEEPDIMAFVRDDFQFESVNLLCECSDHETKTDIFLPATDNVFELYKQKECWQR